jgi:hypothetical protein
MIWFALFAGPVAWALRQLASYALVSPACGMGSTQPLIAIAAAMLGLTLLGAWTGRLCLTRSRADGRGAVMMRASFMASVAVGLNLLVALLIVLSTVAEFILSPCE